MEKQTFVKYFDGRRFFVETETREVLSRDVGEAVKNCPDYCYGFLFYDKTWKTAKDDDGNVYKVDKKAANESGVYYIDGKLFTCSDIEAHEGDHEILLSNMRINGWGKVVQTRTGNFQSFDEGDRVI